MNQNQRHRHAYLHNTLAGESEHVVAAALELRAHKNKQGVAAGHLFVDSAQAAQTTRSILTAEMGKLWGGQANTWNQVSQQNQNKYRDLYHAHQNLIDLSDQNAVLAFSGPQDKLYVKGHGSPRNPDSISTIARTKTQQGQEFVKEALSIRHDMRDVAQGVHNVADKLGHQTLDVRLTSCGSGGGYEFDDQTDTINPSGGTGAAGRLKQELQGLGGQHVFFVKGYRGSSNTTNPANIDGGRHFRTNVKMHNYGDQTYQQVGFGPIDQTFGQNAPKSLATRKIAIEQHSSLIPMNQGMQQKINWINQVRGPNQDNRIKRTNYVEHDEGVQVTMRRSKARVLV